MPSNLGDTTKDLKQKMAELETIRATIGVYKAALDNAISHISSQEGTNVLRLNQIRQHIEEITNEYEESIKQHGGKY